MLSLRLCVGQRLAHVARVVDRLSAYGKNDIAGLTGWTRLTSCRFSRTQPWSLSTPRFILHPMLVGLRGGNDHTQTVTKQSVKA